MDKRTQSQFPLITRVVNIQKESYDVYIGRPSEWGNPFIIGVNGDRDQVIEMYKEHILNSPELLEKLYTLKGMRLGCWCKPLACHGDVLVALVEDL